MAADQAAMFAFLLQSRPIYFWIKRIIMRIMREDEERPYAIVAASSSAMEYAITMAMDNGIANYQVRGMEDHRPGQGAFRNHRFIVVEQVLEDGIRIYDAVESLPNRRDVEVIVVYNDEQGGLAFLEESLPDVRFHVLRSKYDELQYDSSD